MRRGAVHQLNKPFNDSIAVDNALCEKINNALADIFLGYDLEDIAKETNFVQRSSSKMNGNEFTLAMVMASIDPKSTPLSGINDNLRSINPRARMTTSGLRQRVNTTEAQEFLKTVYQIILKKRLEPLSQELNTLGQYDQGALKYFTKVLLHDSSSCVLNEVLNKEFKGSGGAASKSLVKLDLIHDLKTNQTEEIIITDVREPDQSLSKRILKHVTEGALCIQDLGYFDIEVYKQIELNKGYYLSRLSGGVAVYLHEEDLEAVDLGKHLQKLATKGQPLDIEVYVTKKKIRTRLVAYPVPDEVFNKRMREYHSKNKHKTPSADWIARQRFTLLITNVPQEMWSWEVVGTVYKIRWQVELIFKVWKSQMSIQYLKGTKPERIRCLLYSRMIAVLLIFGLYRIVTTLARTEVSLTKFVNWLKRNGRFTVILLKGFTTELWGLLINNLDLLCKDTQRKRKTTLEMVVDADSFLDIFNEKARKCA